MKFESGINGWKQLIKNSYIEGEDYIVKIGTKKWGGSEKKLYFLTSECFKLLVLRSHAEKAESIRKYYIKLEELVSQYKDEILELYENELSEKRLDEKYISRKGRNIYYSRNKNSK